MVDIFFSETVENEALNISVSNIHAGANAQVFRKVVQDWNEKTVSFQLDTTVADRDAQVKNVAVNIGAERARFENQTRIEGAGADVKMYSLTVAEGTQEFDQRTYQTHNAPNAVSDLLYKNALLDNSRTIFSGLIKVAEGSQQTDAYQTNRNLLLDPSADANALPGLEILANDVRCSHGADHRQRRQRRALLHDATRHTSTRRYAAYGLRILRRSHRKDRQRRTRRKSPPTHSSEIFWKNFLIYRTDYNNIYRRSVITH